jgi:hypothetical protein
VHALLSGWRRQMQEGPVPLEAGAPAGVAGGVHAAVSPASEDAARPVRS